MKKFLTISAAAIAAALVLAGCSTNSNNMPGMNHSSSSSAPAAAIHNAADTAFAQMMIPHHAQAVEMSDMMLKKQDLPVAVRDLAIRIKAAQGPEIEKMTAWLTSWNEQTTMAAGHGQHGMEGMMGDAELKKLDAAQGVEAAKLFLTQMDAHHQGAIAMAKTEAANGKNPEAVELAKGISTSQEAEIQEMKKLLAGL